MPSSVPGRIPASHARLAATAALGGLTLALIAAGADGAKPAAPGSAAAPARFTETVPGTAITFDCVPVAGCDGTKPFLMATTEVPWELFDAFIYQLDRKNGASTPASDAVVRPTKPYVSVDRGFGHQGWPAISMSAKGAVQFCEWLSKKTGRTYRLATVDEWKCAAKQSGVTAATMGEYAWMDPEANVATHKCGTKKADKLGLSDLWGNAAEWVSDGKGGFAILGGSYREDKIDPAAMDPIPETTDWNESDPQFPKSIWWLVDGPFIGMRVVTSDAAPAAAPATPATPAAPAAPDAKPAAPATKPG